ncbi:MAG: DUF4339 domain-containing protein [Prevotella sp.]|nr:DUF4339 domain-containing protein [Prevotella sp.]
MIDNSNFFSLDRLVEFGMSASIAQQMVASMNQQMQQMQYPAGIQMMPQPQNATTYYVAIDGQPCGPLDEKELARMIYDKRVTKDTLCWMPGMAKWQPVGQVPAVLRIVALTPPPLAAT